MKIQLKRSNQLDGGAAKQPTAAQMEYGELAVNYNDEDPAIFIKDSDDNIIRIAGVGSISSGDVPSGGSGDKPDAPSLGDLYFDTDLNILLYWNGNEWIEISPTLVADGSTAALPDAAEHGEGTLWWDSDAASGKLFICYDDPGQGKVWVEASPMPNGGALPDISDPNNQGGTLDSRYVRADVTDHKQGNLTIGDGPGNNNIQLNEDGSATFTNDVEMRDLTARSGTFVPNDINSSSGTLLISNSNFTDINFLARSNGQVEIGGSISSNDATTQPNITLDNDGKGYFKRVIGNSGLSSDIVFAGQNNGADTFTVKADGSAEFAETVTAGGLFSTSYVQAGRPSEPTCAVLSSSGSTIAGYSSGTKTFDVQASGTTIVGPSREIVLNNDGSASFAGQVKSFSGNREARINPNGSLKLKTDETASKVIDVESGLQTEAFSVYPDGSAEFAGSVTSDTAGTYNFKAAANGTTYAAFYASDQTLKMGNLAASNYNITLNATDGSAEFADGDIQLTENGRYLSNSAAQPMDLGTQKTAADQYSILTLRSNTSSPGSGQAVVNMKSDGSAEFAGSVTTQATYRFGDGSARLAGDTTTDKLSFIINDSSIALLSEDRLDIINPGLDPSEVITLSNNGSATFAGTINANNSGATDDITTPGAFLSNFGSCYVTRPADKSNLKVWGGFLEGSITPTSQILADGSAEFAGDVTCRTGIFKGNPDNDIAFTTGIWPAEGTSICKKGDGNTLLQFVDAASDDEATIIIGSDSNIISFKTAIGNSRIRLGAPGGQNVFQAPLIDLDGDDGSAEFAGTVTANGTILTRAGGTTLDVGDRLEKADAALQTLKTAAAAAADFAELKAAIATALVDI